MVEILLIILLLFILAPIIGILIGGFFNAVGAILSFIFKSFFVVLFVVCIFTLFTTSMKLFSEYYLYIFPPFLTMIATVLYFKRVQLKKTYISNEKIIINRLNKISQNSILRAIIVILLIIITYLLIF